MAGTTTYYGISYPTSTDYVKDGATAMQTIATGFDSAVAIPTYNNQTGTTYTFVLADTGKTVTASNASASTYTIPPQSSVAWASGATLTVRNLGAGVVTFAGGSGVTVTNTAATLAQYTSAKLIRTASDAWTVVPEGSSAGLTLISTQTPSAASAVNFTNVFNSSYTHYRIVGNLSSASGAPGLFIRARMNTTDQTSGYYGSNFVTKYNGTTTITQASNNAAYLYAIVLQATTLQTLFSFDIMPNGTSVAFAGTGYDPYESGASLFGGGVNTSSNVTGITLYPASTTITGTISLYGYKKA